MSLLPTAQQKATTTRLEAMFPQAARMGSRPKDPYDQTYSKMEAMRRASQSAPPAQRAGYDRVIAEMEASLPREYLVRKNAEKQQADKGLYAMIAGLFDGK